eukprot:TRINITY_DN4227_c3_g1_i2.p1 TRINITY_DN4227_c3_g1~~TRINITY_DN4227_c3_g1_i2.p1  ORF type:complete len:199 (-),score=-8.71 TRINITY_DN4227_c3_g1_i2:140-736(-)
MHIFFANYPFPQDRGNIDILITCFDILISKLLSQLHIIIYVLYYISLGYKLYVIFISNIPFVFAVHKTNNLTNQQFSQHLSIVLFFYSISGALQSQYKTNKYIYLTVERNHQNCACHQSDFENDLDEFSEEFNSFIIYGLYYVTFARFLLLDTLLLTSGLHNTSVPSSRPSKKQSSGAVVKAVILTFLYQQYTTACKE